MTPDSELTPVERVPCPACAEPVLPMARKCRYCGEWFADLWAWSDRNEGVVPAQLSDIEAPFDSPSLESNDTREDDLVSESVRDVLRVEAISLRMAPNLIELVDTARPDDLMERLRDVRTRIAGEFGVIVPAVRVRPDAELDAGEYEVRINGAVVAAGEIALGRVMAIGADLSVPGIDVEYATDPMYGTPAVWLDARYAQLAEDHGLQVFDADDVLATHVAEIAKQHLGELLTREGTAELLNLARSESPMVVQELVPNMLALGQLRKVLQNLVAEQVAINDMSTILNTLADNAVYTKDPYSLTEHVRQALGRQLCVRYQGRDNLVRAFLLSPDAERAIQNAIQLNETGHVLMLDPQTSSAIQNNVAEALNRHRGEILDPIVVTPPKIRRHVKRLLERHFSTIVVLSYAELVPGIQVENLEMIEAHPTGESPRQGATRVRHGGEQPLSDWLLDEGDEPTAPQKPPIEGHDTPPGAMDWNW